MMYHNDMTRRNAQSHPHYQCITGVYGLVYMIIMMIGLSCCAVHELFIQISIRKVMNQVEMMIVFIFDQSQCAVGVDIRTKPYQIHHHIYCSFQSILIWYTQGNFWN